MRETLKQRTCDTCNKILLENIADTIIPDIKLSALEKRAGWIELTQFMPVDLPRSVRPYETVNLDFCSPECLRKWTHTMMATPADRAGSSPHKEEHEGEPNA